jgi:arginine decarboxylase
MREKRIGDAANCNNPISNITSILIPRKVFLTSGVGVDSDPLISFEFALRDAGIEKFNLVPVSSILPPGCKIVEKEEGLEELIPGQIVFCVMAKITSCEEGKKIFASIGAAIPPSPSSIGYIAEHTGYGDERKGEKYAEKLAEKMLESAFGLKPARVISKTASANVASCTTAVAAAVFVV